METLSNVAVSVATPCIFMQTNIFVMNGGKFEIKTICIYTFHTLSASIKMDMWTFMVANEDALKSLQLIVFISLFSSLGAVHMSLLVSSLHGPVIFFFIFNVIL